MALVPSLRQRKSTEVWDPFQELWDWQRDVNRMFTSLGNGPSVWSDGPGSWNVPIDVYEEQDDVIVKAEVSGLDPKDIDVSVTGDVLTIIGERRQEQESKGDRYYRRELAYGTCQRTVQLPHAVNTDALKATCKNGILTIRLPRREEAKSRQVKIDTA